VTATPAPTKATTDGGVWAPARRALTAGLVLTITLAAFESFAVATALPVIREDLGGLGLYGWVFSAYLLGSLVGIVIAGDLTDRFGPAVAYGLGLVAFAAGLVVGGLAPTMAVLVGARLLQGAGGGAIPAVAYVVIGRRYPHRIRPRMFAVLSTAWVVPGLVGPALAGAVAENVGWRWVFLGLLPLVALSALLTLPALRAADLGPGDAAREPSRLPTAVAVAAGAGLLLAGLSTELLVLRLVFVPAGLALGLPALRRLVPKGTLTARPGLPATIVARATLTFSFFGAEAYLPLTLTSVRGYSATAAGVALTSATLTWTAASWFQARHYATWGPRRLVTTGHVMVAVGIAGLATVLADGVPVAVAYVAWAVGGGGIGLAYAAITLTVLRDAPEDRQGFTTSALQLCDVLGMALGTGLGGAFVATGDAMGWDEHVGLGLAFGISGAVALAGVAVSRRLADGLGASASDRSTPTRPNAGEAVRPAPG
jgi:MFS family permease